MASPPPLPPPPPPPPPYYDAKIEVLGYPAPPPPPPSRGRRPRDHASKSLHRSHPRQPRAPLSNQQLQLEISMVLMVIAVIATPILWLLIATSITGPDYPILKVAGLTVSNLTITTSAGATWEAFVLVESPDYEGDSFFHRVECFVYYHGDAAKPLASSMAEPFEMRDGSRALIEAKMTMELPEEAVVEDMDRERRSAGMVAVGLGLRMRGPYVFWSGKQGHARMEVYCNNLRVAFRLPSPVESAKATLKLSQ